VVQHLLAVAPQTATETDADGHTRLYGWDAALLLAAVPAAATVVDANGRLPIRLAAACFWGCTRVVQQLLVAAPHAAVVMDAGGWTPLHCAAWHGQTATVELLQAAAPGTAAVRNLQG
jgi:ankyrin repeat protein